MPLDDRSQVKREVKVEAVSIISGVGGGGRKIRLRGGPTIVVLNPNRHQRARSRTAGVRHVAAVYVLAVLVVVVVGYDYRTCGGGGGRVEPIAVEDGGVGRGGWRRRRRGVEAGAAGVGALALMGVLVAAKGLGGEELARAVEAREEPRRRRLGVVVVVDVGPSRC